MREGEQRPLISSCVLPCTDVAVLVDTEGTCVTAPGVCVAGPLDMATLRPRLCNLHTLFSSLKPLVAFCAPTTPSPHHPAPPVTASAVEFSMLASDVGPCCDVGFSKPGPSGVWPSASGAQLDSSLTGQTTLILKLTLVSKPKYLSVCSDRVLSRCAICMQIQTNFDKLAAQV